MCGSKFTILIVRLHIRPIEILGNVFLALCTIGSGSSKFALCSSLLLTLFANSLFICFYTYFYLPSIDPTDEQKFPMLTLIIDWHLPKNSVIGSNNCSHHLHLWPTFNSSPYSSMYLMIPLYVSLLQQEVPKIFVFVFIFNHTFTYHTNFSAYCDRKQSNCVPNFQPTIHVIVWKKLFHSF